MESRLNYIKAAPEAAKAMYHLEQFVSQCGLEASLLNLVKLRASLINGCAYCVDMHTQEAIKAGESERRLFAVPVWRETPFFNERERAALAWTEAVTLINETHAPDALYQEVIQHFDEKETVNLTLAIATINSWNRLAIGFRMSPKQ